MKKYTALLLTICLLFISGCSRKSDNVRSVESLIRTIGSVNLSNEERIQHIEKKYNSLSDEEKEQIENAAVLIDACEQLEKLRLDEVTSVYLDI